LVPEGARAAKAKIASRVSRGTGVGSKARIDTRVSIASGTDRAG